MDGSMYRDLPRRLEQKYLFPAGYNDVIRSWLEHACVPDPRYPSSLVSSIYFDTPELFHFHESRNGEFLRAKVRLRWYTDPSEDPDPAESVAGVRCYLEVKTKQGALTEKKRAEITIPRQVLGDAPFSHRQILELTERVFRPIQNIILKIIPIFIFQLRQHYIEKKIQK